MPPDQHWYCKLTTFVLLSSAMCSVLFITSMTFDRLYSIIRPHMAASFNTVKRAKITIVIIVILTCLFEIPHLFTTTTNGRECIPYGAVMKQSYGKFYFWLTTVLNFLLPFVLLLSMNCVIIRTLITRSSKFNGPMREEGQGQSEGQTSQLKSSKRQIIMMLLLVTFGFLILSTPVYVMVFFINFADTGKTPKDYAAFYLFYNVGQKLCYLNYGINFIFYVLSGKKFRTDLLNLFKRSKSQTNQTVSPSTVLTNIADSRSF